MTKPERWLPTAIGAAIALSLAEHRPHHPDDDHLIDMIKAALKGAGIDDLDRHERDVLDAAALRPQDVIDRFASHGGPTRDTAGRP